MNRVTGTFWKGLLTAVFSIALLSAVLLSVRMEAFSAKPGGHIRALSGPEIHRLFPEAQGRPLLIEFRSRFCLDCRRMKPVLEKRLLKFPALRTVILDIQEDRKTRPDVFDAFKPAVVPMLVFVRPDGSVSTVLYGYQSEKTLDRELRKILPVAPVTKKVRGSHGP